ncbi:T9SS type A sorting domain-containing protein [Hyunsoonleella sp. SJ7]|uniref:T9SS type A sorting domain-containing protein n=1 Tax=Hyunsoonleella aquatilis TaxID=2762758 RepID=A0A923H8N1_9FLAO|nr:T9SS type A sorting domain-containing protein [Hyunsoonleella aquatilis]MBC3756852.1 T9SS type A sorting domain-containing protein [Hyunsoonleella aquatilis]
MKKIYLILCLASLQMTFGQPANDDCANAELITIDTSLTSFSFEIVDASVNNELGCTTTADYVDVWYEFTMPVNGNLYINGVSSWNNFALYDACNGNMIQCGINNQFISGLTSGTNYKLRVFRTVSLAGNAFTSFGIQAFEEVNNDTCATAEPITVTAEALSYDFNIGGAEVLNEVGCDSTADYVDIWYEFTMPVNGNLHINGVTSWNNFTLYDTCNGNRIQCGNNNQFISGLTSGTNYKLRVFRTVSLADNAFTSFGIQAFEEVNNDTCATAETITVTTEALSYDFNIGGAEVLNEVGCDSTADYVDIWYEFTMPVNGNLYIDSVTSWNNFTLYDTCNGNRIQCGNNNQFISGLTSGTNYKLRVFRTVSLADNAFTSFGIQAFEEVNNDTCATAEPITVTAEALSYDFNIGGAEVLNEVGCDSTADYVDIWYEFTMPVTGNLYINSITSWNNFTLYDACNGNRIQCGNNNQFISGLTSGTNYKLRVFRTVSLADNGFTSFGIQAFEEVNNDTCATAENFTVTEDSITTINFEIGGATVNDGKGCTTGTNEDYVDIWYSFEMPVNGDIEIDGNITWNNFAIFDNCMANNSFACFEESGTVTNLSANNTYWIRVFRTIDLADNTANTSFNISIVNSLSTTTFTNADVRVFPNPTNNIINIHSSKSFDTLELYNIQGKKIISIKSQNKLSIGSLESGIYILKIKSQLNKQVVKRIVIN